MKISVIYKKKMSNREFDKDFKAKVIFPNLN